MVCRIPHSPHGLEASAESSEAGGRLLCCCTLVVYSYRHLSGLLRHRPKVDRAGDESDGGTRWTQEPDRLNAMHSLKGFPWPLRSPCPWRSHIRADLSRPATCSMRAKCVLYIALHREWGPAASRLDLKTTIGLGEPREPCHPVLLQRREVDYRSKSFELSFLLMTAAVDRLAASRPMLLGRTLKGRSFHVLLFLGTQARMASA
ncbi:uncharacterized protein BDZ83DRAFT_368130 [Colletotrichum acutatum]|uniref:Uncharacterized protein n=1 Tax=Glomerella acutata TaxID=27357 RepID=A0AAD8UMQ6_GLOAC|nr:uncharacterized protein BDZ83DRAFT_368130 [Colletotrichum acutatum]KAK1723924.1 hypothetical protein BDZ83DRAFT_368130 [Colletotrichum acutatum]